jgi:hypothetical protein
VSAKNVIIAKRIGDIPLPSEKFPNDKNAKITTPIEDKNPATRATKSIIAIPMRSTFGGPSNSSFATETSPNVLLLSDIIYKKYKASTNSDKYIRKIQNSKVFYRDEVHYISIPNTLIPMRNRTSENQSISDIEKLYIFWIFYFDEIKYNSEDQYYCNTLKEKSLHRKREGNSSII